MSNVVGMLNQLLRSGLGSTAAAGLGSFQPTDIRLTPDGARVEGRLDHPRARGTVAFDLEVISRPDDQFSIAVQAREIPGELDALLEPFRRTLERFSAEVRVDLGDTASDGR